MIEVVVPCSCPGKPHEQDTVSLAPVADVLIGSAVLAAMQLSPATIPEMEGAISVVFLHTGPRGWTFVDAEGGALPLTQENIDERLTWTRGGMEVAEKANELYAGDVFAPLVARMSKGSKRGRTAASTSPTLPVGSTTDSSDKPSLRTVTGGRRSAAKAS